MKVGTVSALLTVALSILAGCASVSPATSPRTPPVVSSEQVVERSYTLGKEHVSFVGGVIARVKDYRVEKTTRQGSIHASRDFSLFYPILGPTVHVKTTDVIPIVGTTERDGAATPRSTSAGDGRNRANRWPLKQSVDQEGWTQHNEVHF